MASDKSSSPIEHVDNLIIGGGISALACARHLNDAGVSFALITDHLGGRLALSERGYYLGAVITNNDYVHVNRYARRASKMRPWNSYVWNGEKGVNFILRMDFFQLLRLRKTFAAFNQSLKRLRAQAPYTCQKTLMERDPLLRKLVSQSARDFVREHNVEALTERLLGPIAGATYLYDWEKLSAFHFCVAISSTSNGARFADWSNTVDSLTRGYTNSIVIDKVKSLEETNDGQAHNVKSTRHQYIAKRVVLSTPVAASAELLDMPGTAQEISCHVFHIDGKRRSLYHPKRSLLMGAHDEIKIFFPQPDGIDVVYSDHAEPNFDRYYEEFIVIEHHFWKTAIQLSQDEWRPLQPKHNLFTIGDYNICGLEDSYLTGLYAANQIIEQTH